MPRSFSRTMVAAGRIMPTIMPASASIDSISEVAVRCVG